jgi:hypothetical protein
MVNLTKEQEQLIERIIDEIIREGIEDLRQLFLQTSKEELLIKYIYEGDGLFDEFKYIVEKTFPQANKNELTIELLSRIFDVVKWLN